MSDTPTRDEIVANNVELLTQLRGLGADLNPLQVMQIRLDVFLDLFYPSGALREFYDFQVERAVGALLEQAVSEVARDRLTDGIVPKP